MSETINNARCTGWSGPKYENGPQFIHFEADTPDGRIIQATAEIGEPTHCGIGMSSHKTYEIEIGPTGDQSGQILYATLLQVADRICVTCAARNATCPIGKIPCSP